MPNRAPVARAPPRDQAAPGVAADKREGKPRGERREGAARADRPEGAPKGDRPRRDGGKPDFKGGKPNRLMIDATHLKAHRTAASLLAFARTSRA